MKDSYKPATKTALRLAMINAMGFPNLIGKFMIDNGVQPVGMNYLTNAEMLAKSILSL